MWHFVKEVCLSQIKNKIENRVAKQKHTPLTNL